MFVGRLRTAVLLLGAASLIAAGSFQLGRSAGAAGAEPGSSADPLVTRSYVDQYVQSYVSQYLQANPPAQDGQTGPGPVGADLKALVDQAVTEALATQVRQAVDSAVPAAVNASVNQSLAVAVPQAVASAVPNYVAAAVPAQVDQSVQQKVGPLLQFQVVSVPGGQTLMAGASTEMILRGGQATVVASPAGGLADVTAGRDLKQGEPVPPNHLLLSPRADGRGILATTDLVLMVKGTFELR